MNGSDGYYIHENNENKVSRMGHTKKKEKKEFKPELGRHSVLLDRQDGLADERRYPEFTGLKLVTLLELADVVGVPVSPVEAALILRNVAVRLNLFEIFNK
jgi:hypothetical protein